MIVKATSKDSLALAKMAIKMWSEHSLDELAKEFEDTIDCEESAIFMLMVDNQAVGFAQCQLRHDYVEGTDTSPVGYLEGIFLEQEFRHRGHAKKLLAQCEEWAKNKGCTEFASDCESDNDESLKFHINMGFTEVNRIICFKKQL
jgi:aminoglycoside 6'-N-acetyltransferase I